MDGTFSTPDLNAEILNWIAVAKGDVMGHPFHGNQYQTGAGSSVHIPSGIHTINGKNVTIARGENLVYAHLSGANLSGTNLSGANLYRANLSKANLRDTNLSAAVLKSANLRGAELINANVVNTNLSGASLYGANLRSAVLSSSDLSNADLTNADLTNTYLNGADLSNADLSGATLGNTTANMDTILPRTHEVVNGFVVARVTKGDLPGHPFRGNQYSGGTASDLATAVQDRVTMATGLLSPGEETLDKEKVAETITSLRDQAESHDKIAAEHRATISDLKALIALNEDAAQTHERAKVDALYASDLVSDYVNPEASFGSEQSAVDYLVSDGGEVANALSNATEVATEAAGATEAANRAPYKSLQVTAE